MFPVQDDLSLITTKYLDLAFQSNPSHSLVTSLSDIRDKKKTINLGFSTVLRRIYRAEFYPPSDYGTAIKPLHIKAVSNSRSLPTHNRVLQTAFSQIATITQPLP